MDGFGCAGFTTGLQAAGAALAYAQEQKKGELKHLVRLKPLHFEEHMALDSATVRNLELIKPLNADDERATLFYLLDKTVTAMGGRALKHQLTHPLLKKDRIEARLDAIDELLEKQEHLQELRAQLREINDIERILGRVGAGRLTPETY